MIEWLRDKKTKCIAALMVGMAVCMLSQGITYSPLAWWGTMYPKFCFSKTDGQEGKVKISFWLAQVLDW